MTSRALDFAFDQRVADQYDSQRAHPPEVSREVGAAIVRLIGPGKKILELGIGTGRIALPVAEAGCSVAGIDLSGDMLAQVYQHAAVQRGDVMLVRGDLHRLPMQEQQFDAVTAVHVLHLLPGWESVLEQAADCMHHEAHFVMGRDWIDPESVTGALQNVYRRAVVELAGPQLKAPTGQREFAAKLASLGFAPEPENGEEIVASEWQVDMSPADFVAGVRGKANPESWILTDELMEPVIEKLEAAIAEHWPDRSAPHPVRRRFLLAAFRRG